MGERQESRGLALRAQRHDQRRADLELGELRCLSGLVLARGAGVTQLREPQVLEPSLEPGEGLEGRPRERLRTALGETAACELHIRDAAVLRAEGGQEGTIGASGTAQQLEIAPDALF